MTNNEARELGERWIKAGGGWHLGMRMCADHSAPSRFREGDERLTNLEGWWPDLRDAATRGAALDVVREMWREPSYSLTAVDESCYPIRWEWIDGGLAAPMLGHKIAYQQFDSEAEALVAALEAVPKGAR